MNTSKDFLKSIRGLSEQDLKAKLNDSKIRLQKLSFSHKVTPLENPRILRNLKRDIARIQTVLNQNKL